MLKKIVLKNFMSHKSSVFELVGGVNVITGPNNSGKSAVISALQLLADLPVKEGDYMVRHGAVQASVTVETAEGDELSWRRKGACMSLAINDEIDMRLQNNREHYLEKLHHYLRLPRVSSNEGKQDFDIHFATQKNPIFLINEPPSRAALFFASTSDAKFLFEVRDKYKEQVKEKRKQLQSAKLELMQQDDILVRLAPLEDIERLFVAVKQIYKDYPREQGVYQNGCLLLDRFSRMKRLQRLHLSKHAIFEVMTSPPILWEVGGLDELLKSMLQRQRLGTFLYHQHNALGAVLAPPQLACEHNLTHFVRAMQGSVGLTRKLKASGLYLTQLKQVPLVADVRPLQNICIDLRKQGQKFALRRRCTRALSQLQVPPAIVELASWENLLVRLKEAAKSQARCREKLNLNLMTEVPPAYEETATLEKLLDELRTQAKGVRLLTAELKKARLALQQWVSEHPTCPTCGGNLNTETLPQAICHG